MTPIISPWIFYFMEFVDTLGGFSVVLFSGGVIVLGLTLFFKCLDGMDFPDENFQKVSSKVISTVSKALVILGILIVFVPSSTTVTKMLVAQNVTYERVEVATDTVERVYEDIMELFESKDDSNA